MRRRGVVLGPFDLLHVGHLGVLRTASALVDELVVAVASDDLVRRRHDRPPAVAAAERVELLEAFLPDAEVCDVDDDDLASLVVRFEPTVVFVAPGGTGVIGADHPTDVVELDVDPLTDSAALLSHPVGDLVWIPVRSTGPAGRGPAVAAG
ncbi:MAG: adenylyltransferase/cytidyltransferase family protein [Microthrixaceae bacterium]